MADTKTQTETTQTTAENPYTVPQAEVDKLPPSPYAPAVERVKKICQQNGGEYPIYKTKSGKDFVDPKTGKAWKEADLLKAMDNVARNGGTMEIPRAGENGGRYVINTPKKEKPEAANTGDNKTDATKTDATKTDDNDKKDKGGFLGWLGRNWYWVAAGVAATVAGIFIFGKKKKKNSPTPAVAAATPKAAASASPSVKTPDNTNTGGLTGALQQASQGTVNPDNGNNIVGGKVGGSDGRF